MKKPKKISLDNKKIIVFGGTGSWGEELIRQIIETSKPKELRVFSRGEHKQVDMRRKYKDYSFMRYIIGDIRDFSRVEDSILGTDVVFNLAALKHVPVCEENVWESVQTNIQGPQNVVNAALKHNPEIVVQVSTDKAVDPINTYGFTKGLAERIITSANFSPVNRGNTKFVCVRGGNVLGTTGSVVPLFKHLIREHNRLTITHEDMSRYFMRVEEAIGLVLKAMNESLGGEVFVMRMPGANIMDLAEVMKEKLGDKNTKITTVGIRPGEKMYEVLVSKNESPRTLKHGNYYIILPEDVHSSFDRSFFSSYKKIEYEEYNSKNTHQLDKKGIKKLLTEDGWFKDKAPDKFDSLFEE